ncbi:MAG: YHS domain-containing protein [Pseudomonadota bacterium]
MNTFFKIFIIALFALSMGAVFAKDTQHKMDVNAKAVAGAPQTICPVLGGPIDKTVFTDYKGQRVYFCCAGCIEKFTKDPQKYLKKMQKEGVVLEKAPKAKK